MCFNLIPPTNPTYKLRAECEADVDALVKLIPDSELVHSACESAQHVVTLTIQVRTLELDEVRAFCRQVVDGHVMMQTVQPLRLYTGERDFDVV